MTDTRDAFEAAYALMDSTADFQHEANNGHDYYFDDEQHAWRIWQAATLAEQENRKPLAKEHIAYLINDVYDSDDQSFFDFARAIETAHGIKP